ncbi:MAG: RNA recognition motif domain-containing protein, partial [Pseudomonadota bacterium]
MSNKKLYVGNLPFSLGDAELANLFSQAGNVESARVVLDPATGRKRGFGFVEMATPEEAQAAVEMFNNTEVEGRQIVVDIARERAPREGGGGGGGYRGGGGGGGGGPRRRPPHGGGGGGGGGYRGG